MKKPVHRQQIDSESYDRESMTFTNEELQALSVLSSRAALSSQAGMQFQGARDTYTEFGYLVDISAEDYESRYARDGLAARIVDKPPADTWRFPPLITDDGQTDTKFVLELDALTTRLRSWAMLHELDKTSRLGEYGVMLLGVAGESELNMPMESSSAEIIYLRTFAQTEAVVKIYDEDTGSARFGKPLIYEVEMGQLGSNRLNKREVHWTRILHVAEGSRDGVVGIPSLKKSFNRLMDLDKIVGAGAEAVWRLIIPGWALTEKEGWDLSETAAELEDKFLDYVHNLKRVLVMSGVDVKKLGPSETPDPSGMFGVLISLIAADIDMPQNILIGTEQGVRASDVDAQTWAGTIANRQANHVEPNILRPFVDWSIAHGAISPPTSGDYEVEWEPVFTLTKAEETEIGKVKASIVKEIVQSGAIEYGLLTIPEARELMFLPAAPDGMSVDDLLDVEDNLPEEITEGVEPA